MRGTKTTCTETLTVLSISPYTEDHLLLETIVAHSRWRFLTANNLFSARAWLLQRPDISVVVCERDLDSGSWIDILKHAQSIQHPPSLIVTSRLADDYLWSEVLSLGGWDVLAKPFDRILVLRSVKSAWEHWYRQRDIATTPKVMKAAS